MVCSDRRTSPLPPENVRPSTSHLPRTSVSTASTSASAPDSAVGTAPSPTPEPFVGLDRRSKLVFAGLMLGMLVASLSQTIVSPAMPVIVADLGGMAHYSWIATSAMLVSAVTVPVVGKLSDQYGRRGFYLAGIAIFLLGSILAGFSTNFWFLVAARAVQGLGMGTLMPLSQTIIGDIIPPRQRGKYQGLMGATFGLASIAGPLIGGTVTDHFGWRYLFFLTLPLGVIAFAFVLRFLHLDHVARRTTVDVLGIITLTPGLVIGLLATSWGGATYAWDSPTIIGMYVAAALLLGLFVRIEMRAENPLLPLGMLARPVVALSILASFAVAVAMFGAIIYIPVYAQAVMGVSATGSGAILIPQSVSMIGMSILSGLLVSRTGRYKEILIVGGLVMLTGYWLLTQVAYGDAAWHLTVAMVVIGLGLGMMMQIFTLVVQNAVPQSELGVATASVQFFRNIGSTVGIAVLGTVMTSRMQPAIESHLPAGASAMMQGGDSGAGVGSVLDQSTLEKLPAPIVEAIRTGMGEAMHDVFFTAIPFVVVAIVLSIFIPHLKLRDTLDHHEPATSTGSVPALAVDEDEVHGEADGGSDVSADPHRTRV